MDIRFSSPPLELQQHSAEITTTGRNYVVSVGLSVPPNHILKSQYRLDRWSACTCVQRRERFGGLNLV